MMDIKELDAKLAETRERKEALVKRGEKAKDIAHIKAITAEIEVLNEEIRDLEKQRTNLQTSEDARSEEIPANAVLVNGESRTMYGSSFGLGRTKAGLPDTTSKFSLRSNETLVSRLPQREIKTLDLGKTIRGMVLGDWTNAAEERSAISTSSVGSVIPQILSATVIDKARNLSLFSAAGVPIVPMESNTMTIARVATDPEFAFKEELAEASESSFSLDSVDLRAKTGYGFCYVSLEAIRSARNLNEILYQTFSQAFANMIDEAMLYGQSGATYAPSGVMNDTDINSIIATNRGYDDYIRAIGQIRRANGVPSVVAMNAATEELTALLTDADGRQLAEPSAFANLTKIVSNQLIDDETNGSDALIFDPKAMIIGVQNQLTIRMINDSDYCIKNGAVGFQIFNMMDCAVMQPKHITKITGIKEREETEG